MKTVEHSLNETSEAKLGLLKQVEKMSGELTQYKQQNAELLQKISGLQEESKRLRERDIARETLVMTLEQRQRRLEEDGDSNQTAATQATTECVQLRTENQQLKKDLNWLAQQAKNNKAQTDKAICDLQAYTQILRGMEKRLCESEAEKEILA